MYKTVSLVVFLLLAGCEMEDWSKPGNLVPMTVDQDPSLPSLHINGTQLRVQTFGTPGDPLLIVVHGGPGTDYRSLLNAQGFAQNHYFVVFYDQRGTGLSKRENKSQYQSKESIQLFIDDLGAIIDYYQTAPGQKVYLLGHSWGAMLATAYINQHPDRIAGAILAEPGGLTWDQAKQYIKLENKPEFFSEGLNDALYTDQIIAGQSEDEILDYKMASFNNFVNAPGNVMGNAGNPPFWRSGAVLARELTSTGEKYGFDFTTNLQAYTTRVLFVYSELNRAYPHEWAVKVSAPFPSKEIVMIENSGHEMLYFGWADFYPKALNYLNELK